MWFDILKEKIDYSDPKWRDIPILRPKGTGNPEEWRKTSRDIPLEERNLLENVETGEPATQGMVAGHGGGAGMQGGARHRFETWKSANHNTYYDAIDSFYKKNADSKGLNGKRSVMETLMGNYWDNHLVLLRQTYDKVEKFLNEVDIQLEEKDDISNPTIDPKAQGQHRDTAQIQGLIGKVKQEDDKALLG